MVLGTVDEQDPAIAGLSRERNRDIERDRIRPVRSGSKEELRCPCVFVAYFLAAGLTSLHPCLLVGSIWCNCSKFKILVVQSSTLDLVQNVGSEEHLRSDRIFRPVGTSLGTSDTNESRRGI